MIDMQHRAPFKKILLVGNPNCGKTTLFNALTGSTQRVGNWSGVTVEQKRGTVRTQKGEMVMVDLPGTYSLLQVNPNAAVDERITSDCIKEGNYDCIVNVVDAANLERNLYLTCQLLEQGVPLIVAINRVDLLENSNQVDFQQLSKLLGVPVVPISASNNRGLDQLIDVMVKPVDKAQAPIPYPESILEAIRTRDNDLSFHQMLAYLEGEPVPAHAPYKGTILELKQMIMVKEGYEPDIVVAQSRYAWIESILHEASYLPEPAVKTGTRQANIVSTLDHFVLHRFWGIPIFFAVMYGLFFFAINIGGAFQDFFDISSNLIFVDGVNVLCQSLGLPDVITALFASGIGKGFNTVITFIPVIGAMFLALSFLEDSGYMARAAFVMDRLMRTIGLPGKSFVPLIVGFGCNVPAIMGARTLEQRRDRVLTVIISPFMSCGARLAIFTLFVAAFFPSYGANIVFLLYFIGITMAVLTGLLLKKTLLKGEPEPLVLELPPYQWPKFMNLGFHAWIKLKRFLLNAGKLIIPVCVIIGALNSVTVDLKLKTDSKSPTLLAQVGKTITPVFTPMGIEKDNWPATVGLFTGIMAKEVVIGTLNSLYAQENDNELELKSFADFKAEFTEAVVSIPHNLADLFGSMKNPVLAASPTDDVNERIFGEMQSRFDGRVGAFAYLLFVLLYFPCISATAAMIKEVDKKWTLFSVGWTTLVAYASSVVFYQLATFRFHPLQSMSWFAGIVGLLSVIITVMRHYKPSKPVPTPIMLSSS